MTDSKTLSDYKHYDPLPREAKAIVSKILKHLEEDGCQCCASALEDIVDDN